MSLNAPKLDDRTFQQIANDLKRRIPLYCPEWTDHNPSDPGITLIELFAYLSEMLLYRINQIPELHYRKFLELLGMQLVEPTPARCWVSFLLSEPLHTEKQIIPAGTEVATLQTEQEPPLIFSVMQDFEIQQPDLKMLIAKKKDGSTTGDPVDLTDEQKKLKFHKEGINVFSSQTLTVGDALYLGFANNISHHILRIKLDLTALNAAGGGRGDPPYVWEVYSSEKGEEKWEGCKFDDNTEDMNHSHYLQIYLPAGHPSKKHSIDGHKLYWVRVRLAKEKYVDKSPHLNAIQVMTMGRAVQVEQAQRVQNEFLGISTGEPGQKFQLQHQLLLPRCRERGEKLYLRIKAEEDDPWDEAPDFADSARLPNQELPRHYTVDSATGEVRFGPTIRLSDGSFKQYGAIPPAGAEIYFRQYRYHSGSLGNVPERAIKTLKTSMSGIRVENHVPASGGRQRETLDELKLRAQRHLRTSARAVTKADFEDLATQFGYPSPLVAQACCFHNQEGVIEVRIVPHIDDCKRQITFEDFKKARDKKIERVEKEAKSEMLQDQLQSYLQKRALLTTRVKVELAEFVWVAVLIRFDSNKINKAIVTEEKILKHLHTFVNPICGGYDGKGWPLNSPLRVEDIYYYLAKADSSIPRECIREISLFLAQSNGTVNGGKPRHTIELGDANEGKAIASAEHKVRFD